MRLPKRNQAGLVPMFHTSVATASNRSRNLHLEIFKLLGPRAGVKHFFLYLDDKICQMPPSTLKKSSANEELGRSIFSSLSPPVSADTPVPNHVFGKNRSTLVPGQNTNSDLLGVSYSMLTVWRHHVKRKRKYLQRSTKPTNGQDGQSVMQTEL
ncbi:hypothetical protein BO83DRAFT_402920 [Aspergillus eucalypticola CBS 122712]|uniref:Uncharacterized protein n=1 Tax=Aspergillus eucalypticola (strain CBS 122712 / IBT 29274) TaxID=1448314 RepID=A0A317UPC7_ASPEC|nr:uncharacterized protein BO83DRAFT_402920 [Aspergillus eucalypticola CBS 122712]PWY63814.1 hypothetical protein BO83DRAFT_402920 [Aspergillus eucalypticola CBS 122712]